MASLVPFPLRLAPNPPPSLASSPSLASAAPQATPDTRIRFSTIDKVFEQIDEARGRDEDILIITHVSPNNFALMEEQRSVLRRRFRFRRYYPAFKTAIITIPTDIHERLHAQLYQLFMEKVFQAGLSRGWLSSAASKYTARRPGGGGGSGEGDSSGGPRPERMGDGWPTLVIEAGYSESMLQLRMDMHWWFMASDHDVKIVILIKFDRNRPNPAIIIERWEEGPPAPRPGATTTRSSSAVQLRPVCQQTITVTRNNTTNPATYDVDKTPLVLRFQLLFLRQPAPGQGDIVFTIADLQDFALCVWDVVH